LSASEAPAVAELVARLEGIPLALELAAARVRSLTVAEINSRLKDRYKILTGGARVHQERQQTLRALVDWSYDLLSAQEQIVLARLGVFVGGFDLAAAEEVCGTDPLAKDDVLDILGSLVDKSLVMLEEHEDTGRYRMLETIRDYAREKLVHRGESDSTASRHCAHYFVKAKVAKDGMKGPEQAEWIQRIETDLDNIRSAAALALDGRVDPFIAVKMANAMQTFWVLRGYATEGRELVRAALALPAIQESDLAKAWALYVGAALAESQSNHAEAKEMLETCLMLRRRLGNSVEIAATLSTLSLARLQTDDAAGATESELEALQMFRALRDRRGEAIGLLHLGQISAFLADGAQACSYFEQCLAIAREIKFQELEGACELLLGEVAFDNDDWTQAVLWIKRSLTICREAADKRGEASALYWLGKCDLRRGDITTARARLGDALRAFRSFEMWDELVGNLEDFAELASLEGTLEIAVRLSAATNKARARLRLVKSLHTEERWQAHIVKLRQAINGPAFDANWQEGCAWEIDDAIRAALSTQREFAAV